MTVHTTEEGLAADTGADAPARRTVGLAVAVGAALIGAWPSAPLWLTLAGFAVALSVGLPLAVADAPRVARAMVPAAVILLALGAGWASIARASGDGPVRDRTHDGGVIITRAAAEDLGAGRNPYAVDFTDELPSSWLLVEGEQGEQVPNPVVDHFPYLPAAAIVHVPFVVGADALGWVWDPRILGWAAMVAAMVTLARRPEPAWQRLGAVAAVGGPFSIVYLSWGTNDVLAVSIAVLALCWARNHPGWAGVALAVALSTKPLLAVLLPPLAVWVVLAGSRQTSLAGVPPMWPVDGRAPADGRALANGGWAALARWWTLPATLVVTCLPALAADPGAFLDDTVWFNLGRTEVAMPTSGLGLPAVASGVFSGLLLAVVTLLGFVVAIAGPIWAVRRWPSVWIAGGASGIALLAVLVPARTFQINYLVLVAALAPLLWLSVGDRHANAPQANAPQANAPEVADRDDVSPATGSSPTNGGMATASG